MMVERHRDEARQGLDNGIFSDANSKGGKLEVTTEMIEAGVAEMERGLIDGCSLPGLRADLVRDVYLVMRAHLHLAVQPHSKFENVVGEAS